MHAWMDGWMNAKIDGWMDGCMNGCMDGWMDEWIITSIKVVTPINIYTSITGLTNPEPIFGLCQKLQHNRKLQLIKVG